MAKKTKKSKKVSLRQRLRIKSKERLEAIQMEVAEACDAAVKSTGAKINSLDVMRLICGSQTKTLRDQLITELANETERELEAIYNKQIGLDLGDTDVSET